MLGKFDYMAFQHANRVLGPLFVVTYIVLAYVILLNMFLPTTRSSEILRTTTVRSRYVEMQTVVHSNNLPG